MPIQFPIPNTAVQQTNPFGVGLQQAQGTANQLMQAPLLKERIAAMKQKRQESQFLVPAKLDQMRAQTRQEQAQAGQAKAQTGFLNQETKFLPLKMALQAANIQQSASRFGPGYQMAKTIMAMPVAARAQAIQHNQAGWDAVINTMGKNALNQGHPTGAMGLVGNMLKSAFPKMYADKGTASGANLDTNSPEYKTKLEATKKALDAAMRSAPPTGTLPPSMQPDGGDQTVQPTFTSTPESVKQDKYANQFEANKQTAGKVMTDQAVASVQVEKWLYDNRKKYMPRIQNALSYAGAIGRGKKAGEQFLNTHNNALSDLDWFKGSFTPGLANRYKKIEAMGATDSQRKELKDMVFSINNFMSNPERARLDFNKMVGTINDIADSAFKSAQPIEEGGRRTLFRDANKLPRIKGDYVPDPNQVDLTGKSISQGQSGQVGTVLMKTPDGKLWHIPADKVSVAKQRGAIEVG